MFTDRNAQATLAVKSLDAARPFYEGVLELTRVGQEMNGVQGYRAGDSTILVYESGFAGTNQATAVTWSLGPDFDQVMQALKAKDVKFERYDLPNVAMDGDVHVFGDTRVAWFKDPDGNIINIGNY